jgi:hypothetical protein
MIRLLHLLAIVGLIGSAAYAYGIKYDTLYQGEQVMKLQSALRKERDAVAVLKAEWQLMTRPDRMQAAVDRHLDLEPMGVQHLARLGELPARAQRGDEIGRKLELLGLGATPGSGAPKDSPPGTRVVDGARTPTSTGSIGGRTTAAPAR